MAFHGFMIIEIPLHDKFAVSIDMHMSRRVISFPPNKDVTTTSEFTHSTFMLPCKVTVVKLSDAGGCGFVRVSELWYVTASRKPRG
jgi:hypothetical protein